MSSTQAIHLFESNQDVFDCLSSARRRQALAALVESSAPVSEDALALYVLSRERDEPVAAVSDDDRTQAQAGLQHRHLPMLADAGLVHWDQNHGTVTTADHPLFDDSTFRRLLERPGAVSDDVISCLADERRRSVIDALETNGEMDLDDLAREVSRRADDESTDDVLVDLHHLHVPKLADAGIVDYDPDEKRVAFDGFAPSFAVRFP